MKKKIAFFSFVLGSVLFAQSEIKSFPDSLNIHPFSANTLEPKMGFLFDVGENELRLDVGNSMDVFHKHYSTNVLSFGVDFFTYSFLERKKDFKFPVVAIDYLFGVNAGYKINANNFNYGLRFRMSHISAHFVDGHYDIKKDQWKDLVYPFVFSKEFFELTPFYEKRNLRIYSTITIIYHIKPTGLGKDAYQIGGEYFLPNIISNNIGLYLSGDLKLTHLDDYNLSFCFQSGLKFGNMTSKGASIYFQFYTGKNIHGELLNLNVNKSSLGINFDL